MPNLLRTPASKSADTCKKFLFEKASIIQIPIPSASFTIKNTDDAPHGTDALLERLLDHFMAKADRLSKWRAEKCSVIIRSEILDKPIQVCPTG